MPAHKRFPGRLIETIETSTIIGLRAGSVRAVRTRSERLKDSIDQARLEKYHTPGSIRFARDPGSEKSRATTTELVPR
jgi:hypothetical protein